MIRKHAGSGVMLVNIISLHLNINYVHVELCDDKNACPENAKERLRLLLDFFLQSLLCTPFSEFF